MAVTPPSARQTPRSSPDVQLNAHLLDCANKYMRDKLEQLAHECDRRLEHELLPRLHATLREIDQERDAFESQKRQVASQLRERLVVLGSDPASIDKALDQLQAVTPQSFTLLPEALSLKFRLSTSADASLSTPSVAQSLDGAFDVADAQMDNQDASTSLPNPVTPGYHVPESIPQIELEESPTRRPSLDSQSQATLRAESTVVSCTPKRPNSDVQHETATSTKRHRVDNETQSPKTEQTDITRRIAFPNLVTGESIFRHAGRKGFFVIRCDYCKPDKPGIFTEPPLVYNRALKHFQKHIEATSDKTELTNESIFERFALQVDGDEMASKYWIREHLGVAPHTFTPPGASRVLPRANFIDDKDMTREQQQIDKYFSPPFPKSRESAKSRKSDHGAGQEEPRRARRNVPRPDYAEMVANKDPWIIEAEAEKGVTTDGVAGSSTSKKRRLTKPGMGSKTRTTEPEKPFGYMSEPWPRRSAPR